MMPHGGTFFIERQIGHWPNNPKFNGQCKRGFQVCMNFKKMYKLNKTHIYNELSVKAAPILNYTVASAAITSLDKTKNLIMHLQIAGTTQRCCCWLCPQMFLRCC